MSAEFKIELKKAKPVACLLASDDYYEATVARLPADIYV
jgi:hypothetical protein